MSIILAMPGKAENQERFWDRCILGTGLEPVTELAFQANDKWSDVYPADLLARFDDHSHIALEQYKHTLPRFRSHFQPKPFAYAFLNYEPEKTFLDGTDSAWVWSKMDGGFNDTDIEAIAQMRRGVQEATDGLPFSVYRTPPIPYNAPAEPFVIKSAREIAEHCEWVWQDAYLRGDPLTPETVGAWHNKLVRDFGALSKLGRRVIPWVWPSQRMSVQTAMGYGAATCKSLATIPGCQHIGVWVDCNHASVTDAQIGRFISIAPYLRGFMEK